MEGPGPPQVGQPSSAPGVSLATASAHAPYACVGRPRTRKQTAGRAEAAPAGGAAGAPVGFQGERLNLGGSPAGTARGDGRVAPGDGRLGGRESGQCRQGQRGLRRCPRGSNGMAAPQGVIRGVGGRLWNCTSWVIRARRGVWAAKGSLDSKSTTRKNRKVGPHGGVRGQVKRDHDPGPSSGQFPSPIPCFQHSATSVPRQGAHPWPDHLPLAP